MTVSYIPDGARTLTAACGIVGCAKAIDVYKKVFDARQHLRLDMPDGTVAHCELRMGDSAVMMGEATGIEPYSMHVMIYVRDCDAVFKRALDAGFSVKTPPTNQFYGDRSARVVDPFGNEWFIATHVEDVTEQEMQTRMARMMG